MLRDEMLTLVLCHKPKMSLKATRRQLRQHREWQMALQKTGYRKVRSGLTISRRDSDYMTATYSGIDPELRRLSRAGAFGVDGHAGNTPLIRLRHLLAMVPTNGIHMADAEPDGVERG